MTAAANRDMPLRSLVWTCQLTLTPALPLPYGP